MLVDYLDISFIYIGQTVFFYYLYRVYITNSSMLLMYFFHDYIK